MSTTLIGYVAVTKVMQNVTYTTTAPLSILSGDGIKKGKRKEKLSSIDGLLIYIWH